jgi:hypothetical protein
MLCESQGYPGINNPQKRELRGKNFKKRRKHLKS